MAASGMAIMKVFQSLGFMTSYILGILLPDATITNQRLEPVLLIPGAIGLV